MSNGSTFVSTHCWANSVCQFDLSLIDILDFRILVTKTCGIVFIAHARSIKSDTGNEHS